VCVAAERLGAWPDLRGDLLRRAAANPAAAAARLPAAGAQLLAWLAGTDGEPMPELAAALVARARELRVLEASSSDKLALFAASVARMAGPAPRPPGGGVSADCAGEPSTAPPGWDGDALLPAALRAFGGGHLGWGGALKVRGARARARARGGDAGRRGAALRAAARQTGRQGQPAPASCNRSSRPPQMTQLRILLDSAARCNMRGRAKLAQALADDLARWAQLDAWRRLHGGCDPFPRRDRLRRQLHGARGAALLLAFARCGAAPPAPLLRWLLRRCVAPGLARTSPFWAARLSTALGELGAGAGLVLRAGLEPWVDPEEALAEEEEAAADEAARRVPCGDACGSGSGSSSDSTEEERRWQLRQAAQPREPPREPLRALNLHSRECMWLLVVAGQLAHAAQQEEAALAAAECSIGSDTAAARLGPRGAYVLADGQHGANVGRIVAEAPAGLAAARALTQRALAALPAQLDELMALPAAAAAALMWTAARSGARVEAAQFDALCAALGGVRTARLGTSDLLRLAWSFGILQEQQQRAAVGGGGGEPGGGSRTLARRRMRVPGDRPWGGAFQVGHHVCWELSGRRLSADDASMVLWALLRLGDNAHTRIAFGRLADRLVKDDARQLRALGAASAVRLATACARAAWAPPALMAALAARGAELARGGLAAPLLAQLMWAAAAAHVTHRGLLDASAARAAELADAFEAAQAQEGGGLAAAGAKQATAGGFTASRQPEALLNAWVRLRFRAPEPLVARLRQAAAALREREGAGAPRVLDAPALSSDSSDGGSVSSSSSSSSEPPPPVAQPAAAVAPQAAPQAAATPEETPPAGPEALAARLSQLAARRRVVRPVHPGSAAAGDPAGLVQ
jgi:hypothetical protein